MENVNTALEIVGGLSKPSKMPWFGYSLPASACTTGSQLRKVKGSICSHCYACKGRYLFGNVKSALQKRLDSLQSPQWKKAMLFLLQTYAKKTAPENRYFRWHDSGDLQSIKHFNDICWIAEKTPDIQHWLPTRETRIVDAYIGNIPNNLTIRYTATMLDTLVKPTCFTHIAGVTTEKDSAVVQEQANTIGVNLHFCKAYLTEGKCDNCRACWDKKVQAVVYLKH